MSYEELLQQAYEDGIIVEEYPLKGYDGLCYDNLILIDSNFPTSIDKACVLAEELGHYYTTIGDILDQSDVRNRKQEYQTRLHGYNHMIGLSGIVSAAKAGCRNRYEVATHLGVNEEYLEEALKIYESKYGIGVALNNYWIMFTPYLQVYRHKKL